MATPQELITAAKALIATEANWSQKAIARTADGEPCGPLSALAVQRDIMGALEKARFDADAPRMVLNQAHNLLKSRMPGPSKDVDKLNDESTHAQVMSFLNG